MSSAHAPAGPRPPLARPSRHRAAGAIAAILITAASLYVVLPRLAGVRELWHEAWGGNVWWIGVAALLEVPSFAGYVLVFLAVLGGGRINRRATWLITLAGVAATRLFAAGGVGGIALTTWALQRAGRDTSGASQGVATFLLLLYGVYVALLGAAGALVLLGVAGHAAPAALAGPAATLAVGALVGVPLLGLVPRHRAQAGRSKLGARLISLIDVGPGAVRRAIGLARGRDRRLLGAFGWWAFDIAALAAALHAFGQHLPVVALVLAYFMGMLGNLLPIPGGIGGVEGGMIGALVACGVDPGGAVGGVLAYRLVSLWLPTLLGIGAYGLLLRLVHRWAQVDGLASTDADVVGSSPR